MAALGWEGWYCIVVILIGVGFMARDIVGPDLAMMGMLVVTMLPGERVVSIDQALAGFANEGLLTVGILFVMAAGISETGGLDYFFAQLLGTPSTTSAAIVRMVIPVMILSAFMNNTPIVAVMIPILTSWARKTGLAPGHLLMPLSFASILGGTVTLIGTSTNLVVAGKQKDAFPDDRPIGLFDLSPYGVPVAITGIIYIMIFAPRVLPGKAKKRASQKADDGLEDAFLVGLQVQSGSPAVGRTVVQAGLRGLDGLYLTSVKRGETVTHAVGPDYVLLHNDILFFVGDLPKVNSVAQRFKLRTVTDAFEEDLPALMGSPTAVRAQAATPFSTPDDSTPTAADASAMLLPFSTPGAGSNELRRTSVAPPTRLMQASIKKDAPVLKNVTVRDAHFRAQFQASIVSIRRQGQKLKGKLGDVKLQSGDELLFDCGDNFDENSEIVKSNLSLIGLVQDDHVREFMVAFEVQGGKRAGERESGDVLPTTNSAASSPPSSQSGMPHVRSTGANMFALGRGGGIAGKTIEAAGLRGLADAFLVAIERGNTTLHAVAPTEVLNPGDILWFAGSPEGVISLRKIPGLKQMDDQIGKLSSHVLDRRLVQVVIARTSELIGKTVKESKFRTRFDAAIIALHREGNRQRKKIGDIQISAGDVLLLDTGTHFLQNHRSDRNFALVAEVDNSQPPRFDRVIIACVCAVAAIVLYITEVLDLFTAAALASAIMLMMGCLSATAARNAVKWDVIVTIAAAFGLSNALEATKGAEAIADLLVSMGRAMGGSAAIQVSMYLATALLSNIVANNAAAALMFPIAINVAEQEGLNKDRMAFLLMLAASASFAVPFGYQTNLMVYGAGGYSFNDFVKFGGPLQIVLAVSSLGVILLHEYLWLIWVVTCSALALCIAEPTISSLIRKRSKKGGRDAEVTSPQVATSGTAEHDALAVDVDAAVNSASDNLSQRTTQERQTYSDNV